MAAGLLSLGVPALADTAPGTLTVNAVVIDRCVVSNPASSGAAVKCDAIAPPHRVVEQIRPLNTANIVQGRTVIF